MESLDDYLSSSFQDESSSSISENENWNGGFVTANGTRIDLLEWFKKRPPLINLKNSEQLEKNRSVLRQFRRLVRRVILNLEWFKALSDEYSKAQEREKLLRDFCEHGDRFGLVDDKMLEFVFNKVNDFLLKLTKFCLKSGFTLVIKNDFRAPRAPDVLLKDTMRPILMKDPATRTQDECLNLIPLIASVPHLNSLPKQSRIHLARLLRLSIYEKNRVIVRECIRPIYFYYILSGGCDVLTHNRSGKDFIKTESLQVSFIFSKRKENEKS